jgi:low affinity Fe/Cu permease
MRPNFDAILFLFDLLELFIEGVVMAIMPTEVDERTGIFDRFATRVDGYTSRAWFFAFCLLLVIVWAPSIAVIRTVDTWQLVINTATTIVTFLLVALLQNTQKRSNDALQHKLNAIADALADLLEAHSEEHPELLADCDELRAAVGLEHRESS